MIVIIWRADIWAGVGKVKRILLGGKGGGETFQGIRLALQLIFQAQKKNTSFVKSSFLAWLSEKAGQEFHVGNGIWNGTFHSEIQEIEICTSLFSAG